MGDADRTPLLDSLPARTVEFIVVLLLPIASFPLAEGLRPEWQSGDLADRAAIHLDPEITVLFAPFIVLAWVATLVAIVDERRVAGHRVTRLALYSGVPMTLHYLAISTVALVFPPFVAVVLIALWVGLLMLIRRRPSALRWITGAAAAVSILGAAAGVGSLSISSRGCSVQWSPCCSSSCSVGPASASPCRFADRNGCGSSPQHKIDPLRNRHRRLPRRPRVEVSTLRTRLPLPGESGSSGMSLRGEKLPLERSTSTRRCPNASPPAGSQRPPRAGIGRSPNLHAASS